MPAHLLASNQRARIVEGIVVSLRRDDLDVETALIALRGLGLHVDDLTGGLLEEATAAMECRDRVLADHTNVEQYVDVVRGRVHRAAMEFIDAQDQHLRECVERLARPAVTEAGAA